jgi:hypothetical protein
LRTIKDGEEVEHEVIEHVRIEDEEVKSRAKKKDSKTTEQLEAEESLELESPGRGYPEDTVIPIAIRY